MRITTLARICCATLLSAATVQTYAQLPAGIAGPLPATLGIGPDQPIPQVINADGTIPDQYIVTLKPVLNSLLKPLNLEQQVQAVLSSVGGGEVLSIYDTVLSGFSVRIPAAKAKLLAALPQVAAIEPNQRLTANAVQNNPSSWGLDRIDQTDLPLDNTYNNPDWQGQGAHIYIIDSGINPNHVEFTGRIGYSIWLKAVAASPWDCYGHGTHVAGTAAGTNVGVAKKATLHSVRVTDCKGNMTLDGVLTAMNWVAKNAEKPAVANLSLGTTSGRSTAWETAARGMVNANIAVAVAAGNQNTLACNRSPSAEPSVLTVGATSKDDIRGYLPSIGYYSNYGSCVDLFAPGTEIVSAAYNDNSGYLIDTGTSMASPHVAGALALWRARFPTQFTAKQIEDGLVQYHTTPNRITNVGAGSPNRLLYINRAPTAAFSYSCKARNCTFDGTASWDENPTLAYSWDFGDGTTATGATAIHNYAGTGTYSAKLTVTDDTTQTGNITKTVLVIALP